MKMTVLLVFAAFSAAAIAWQTSAEARSSQEAAVRAPLENYIKGHATGDGSYIRKAFHKDAKIMSYRNGKFNQVTLDEFAARFTGKPADDESRRKRWIDKIEITGNVATARIILDYPQMKFTDYMTLLEIDGEWKIVNKAFYVEMKANQ